MVTYPEDWKEFRFKDTGIEVSKGQVITRADVRIGEIPVVAGGMEPAYYCDKYNRDGFTVTISASGANAGYVNLYKGKIFASDCSTISEAPNYDVRYIYYLLLNKQNEIYDAQTGGAQPHIHPKDIYKLPIVYTSNISEQQAIASALSDFDEHIDNLSDLIEKKKAIRDGALEDLVSGRTRLDGFNKEVREYKPIKSVYKRVKGTPITAGTMNEINMSTGAIRVFAGGNTECRTNSDYLSNANIIREPIVIVQSRGVIDFIYCDEPCTFKNEMWGYTSLGISDVRFLFYYLKHNIEHFRNEGTGRSSFSQISLPVTEEYLIPVVSMKEQKEIVDILTAMDEEIESLKIEKEKMIQIKEGAMDDLLTGRVRLKV